MDTHTHTHIKNDNAFLVSRCSRIIFKIMIKKVLYSEGIIYTLPSIPGWCNPSLRLIMLFFHFPKGVWTHTRKKKDSIPYLSMDAVPRMHRELYNHTLVYHCFYTRGRTMIHKKITRSKSLMMIRYGFCHQKTARTGPSHSISMSQFNKKVIISFFLFVFFLFYPCLILRRSTSFPGAIVVGFRFFRRHSVFAFSLKKG